MREGRPHKLDTISQFLETFSQSDLIDEHLLCKFYLHDLACLLDRKFDLVPYVGDVWLRAFTSFVNNQVRW